VTVNSASKKQPPKTGLENSLIIRQKYRFEIDMN
jgi:hypothetical protein